MNLLHLVSEQTVQNLLPIIALQPDRVIQIRSQGERFEQAARRLVSAVETLVSCGVLPAMPEFFDEVIDSIFPSIEGTRRKVGGALAIWPGCVVNITGGTKPMSIGAWLSADYQNEPALYCDSQSGKFVSVGKKVALPAMPPLREVTARLTVDAVLSAHGIPPESLKSSVPTAGEIAFARTVHNLHSNHPEEIRLLFTRIRSLLYPDNKNRPIPRSRIDHVLAAGLPGPDSDPVHQFYLAAEAAGYLRQDDGKFFFLLRGTSLRSDDRLRATSDLVRTLVGGWFEILTCDQMKAGGRYTDLRTGVQSRDQSLAMGETDIVGVDLNRTGLVFVSCKLSDEHLTGSLEHVFALSRRAIQFGGTFSRAIFRVGRFGKPERKKTVASACELLRIQLVEGDSPHF